MKNSVRKYFGLTICIIFLEMILTITTVYLYQVLDSYLIKIIVQNVSYLIILVFTFIGIKMSHMTLREFGLFSYSLPKQLGTGFIVGFILLCVLKGGSFWPPSLDIYLMFSQLLVAFTEELLFRGFLFTMVYEISHSKMKSILISSVVFGLYHYPIHHDILFVFASCIIGLTYSGLHSLYFKTDKEIGILSLTIVHWINNIF